MRMDDENWRLFPVVRAETSGLLIVDTELLDLVPLAEFPIAVVASLALGNEETKAQTDRLENGLQAQIEKAGASLLAIFDHRTSCSPSGTSRRCQMMTSNS